MTSLNSYLAVYSNSFMVSYGTKGQSYAENLREI